MDFRFSPEQDELRRMLRDLSADRASSAARRAAMESAAGYDADLWQLLDAELGLTALALAEDAGGSGGDFIDAAVVLEEAGRCLLPAPLLASTVASVAAAEALPGPSALAVGPVDGDAGGLRATLHNIADGHLARTLVVAAPDALWSLSTDARGVRVEALPALDQLRRQATVHLDGAPATWLGDAPASARAVDVLRVALALEAVGIARRCLEMTVEHLKTRVQFGKPIGSFQALQHRAADLAVLVESAASTAYYAAWTVAAAPDELPVVAPLAKSVCADAAYSVAAEAIQMHGGIGFTWEHDLHLFFKRATVTRLLLGDAHVQRRLVAERAGLR